MERTRPRYGDAELPVRVRESEAPRGRWRELAARKERVWSNDLLAVNTAERRREQTKLFDEEGLVVYKNKITDVEDMCREDENELEGKTC